MKQLILISPLASNSLMGGDFFFRMPCLSLLKVAALTPPDWNISIMDEKVETLDFDLPADLVGITTMTPTANRAYQIADQFRERGIKVVLGGMHVSQLPDEGLKHSDSVVLGEAEELWPQLLADFGAGALKQVYLHENELPSLDQLPTPNWELVRSKKYLPVHFVETTRGCPLNCEFCAVTNAFGGRYRNRSQDDVLAELHGLKPFAGLLTLKNCVFFIDDNIIANRSYARTFLQRIAELNLKWFGQASVNIANDEELLTLCQKSGCIGIFIGFESLSADTLKSIGKRLNHPQNYLEGIRKIHDHGIGIDASFVFGFDTDDLGVFDRTLAFALKAKLDVAYFSILTPYPGTRLYARLNREQRLLTHDWSLYDGNRVVFRPINYTPDELLDGYYHVLKEFYKVPSIFNRLWGSKTYKNFFYPMNFGFRQSVKKRWQVYRSGAMRVDSQLGPGI